MPESTPTTGSEPAMTLTPPTEAAGDIQVKDGDVQAPVTAPAQMPEAPKTEGEADPNVPEWLRGVDAELQSSPSLRKFHNVEALAKSYEHLQKSVGKDKYTVPDKHATTEDWVNTFRKLGAPEEASAYELSADESVILPDEMGKIAEGFAEAGLHPMQAQKMLEWYQNYAKGQIEGFETQKTEAIENTVAGLKKDWGQAYDRKIAGAQNIVKAVASEEDIKYLEESGLGNDPRLVKLFASIHDKYLGEDTKAGQHDANTGGGTLTPADAQAEINKIIGDSKHPYHVKEHPNHKTAVAEVSRLFGMVSVEE